MATSPNERIGPKHAGDRLGVSDQTVRDMIHRKELPAIRVGKQFRILVKDLDDYIARQAGKARARDALASSHLSH
jgi:excisionase family DNA binding protein